MREPSQIIKIFAFIVAVIAISAVVLFTLKDKIATKAGQIARGRSMIISLDKRENDFVNLKNDYGLVKTNLPKIKSHYLEVDDLDKFIEFSENSAREFGGTSTIRFSGTGDPFGQNLKKLDFTLSFSGKKEFFANFVTEIQKFHYIIKIGKIDMKYAPDSEPDSMDILNINASIFTKK